MRGKITKKIDFLVADKEVLTKSEIENQTEVTNLLRRKKRFWNKTNKINRSKRTAMLRKVMDNREKENN